MPNSVARLVLRAVAVVLGKILAAYPLQMLGFGEIGSDQEKWLRRRTKQTE